MTTERNVGFDCAPGAIVDINLPQIERLLKRAHTLFGQLPYDPSNWRYVPSLVVIIAAWTDADCRGSHWFHHCVLWLPSPRLLVSCGCPHPRHTSDLPA